MPATCDDCPSALDRAEFCEAAPLTRRGQFPSQEGAYSPQEGASQLPSLSGRGKGRVPSNFPPGREAPKPRAYPRRTRRIADCSSAAGFRNNAAAGCHSPAATRYFLTPLPLREGLGRVLVVLRPL